MAATLVMIAAAVSPIAGFAQDRSADDATPSDTRGGIKTFESVTVERVHPGDLPHTSRPGAKTALRTASDQLPGPASQRQLKHLAGRLGARVVEVISVQTPPRPYRQTPMVFFGHGVWVNPPAMDADSTAAKDPKKPVLVTSLSWLSDADEVFILASTDHPDKARPAASRARVSWRAQRRSLRSLGAGGGDEAWLDEHRDDLVSVDTTRADRHRNLVTLTSKDGSLSAPEAGLDIFDVDHKAIFRLYGFSPYLGPKVIHTTIKPTHPENVALAFYWQTGFSAILGAPLVSQDGKLVAINAIGHPEKKAITLAIPTGAISSYLSPDADDDDI